MSSTLDGNHERGAIKPIITTELLGDPLFEALVCETHHAAAATAIVTSSLNCSVEKRSLLDKSTIDRFLPIELLCFCPSHGGLCSTSNR